MVHIVIQAIWGSVFESDGAVVCSCLGVGVLGAQNPIKFPLRMTPEFNRQNYIPQDIL